MSGGLNAPGAARLNRRRSLRVRTGRLDRNAILNYIVNQPCRAGRIIERPAVPAQDRTRRSVFPQAPMTERPSEPDWIERLLVVALILAFSALVAATIIPLL